MEGATDNQEGLMVAVSTQEYRILSKFTSHGVAAFRAYLHRCPAQTLSCLTKLTFCSIVLKNRMGNQVFLNNSQFFISTRREMSK
jgi:hypothetical protein